MRRIRKREKTDALYTEEDVLNTRDSLKKAVVKLLAEAEVSHMDFKQRYLDYYTTTRNLTVKKATEKFNNDLRSLQQGATLTYGKVSIIIRIVLKMTLERHTLELVDMDGNRKTVTINVQGF